MHDPIPGNGEKHSPKIDADHDAVVGELLRFMCDGKLLVEEMATAQDAGSNDLLDKLTQLGYYFIPITDEGDIVNDLERHNVQNIATICALTTLDLLCAQLNIDKMVLREAWLANGLITIVDVRNEKFSNHTPKEKHEAIAEGIVEAGHRLMAELPEVYSQGVDMLSDDSVVVKHPGVFKGVYGHVFGSGYKVLSVINDFVRTQAGHNTVPIHAERGEMSVADIDHLLLADQLDTEIFYPAESDDDEVGSSSPEAYIGQFVEKVFDFDDEAIDAAITLAWCLYSNDSEYSALNDVAQSFLHGAILGMKIFQKSAHVTGVELPELLRIWKLQHTHSRMRKSEWADENLQLFAVKQVAKQLDRENPISAYGELLDKLCDYQEFDVDETAAFKNGFEYMLATGATALEHRKKTEQNNFVNQEMQGFDEELRQLLGGQDS